MMVLAFDTATSSCAIVLWQDGEILAKAQETLERGHAEILVPMIEGVLAQASLDYQNLDLIAVTIGPGAFTGIRIGLATARSLALASNLPLIGVTNFEALVHGTPALERAGAKILVVLETKRADFYACLFDENLAPVGTSKAVDVAGVLKMAGSGPLLLVGDAVERALPIFAEAKIEIKRSSGDPHVDPAILAELAAKVYSADGEMEPPLPLYLKPPDVNMSGVKPPTRIFK